VDELLDELAARSEFTCASIRDAFPRQTRRNERQIMAELFENTTPFEAALLVQVIQRDLRPLIYPLSTTDTRASLLSFNSNAIKPLDFHQAMRVWDPSGTLTRAYDTRSSLEAAADAYELGLSNAPEPVVGIAIEVCLPRPSCLSEVLTYEIDPSKCEGTVLRARPAAV
jgi:DNA ligase 4